MLIEGDARTFKHVVTEAEVESFIHYRTTATKVQHDAPKAMVVSCENSRIHV
jgi:hypothetical protein